MKTLHMLATLSLAVAFIGCEKAPENPVGRREAPKQDEHGRAADDKSAAPGGPSGHGGEAIALGTTKLGAFDVRASRDKGDIKPGGDAPIDVWIDGGVGKGVTAVRFWIGTQDAKGSIKAKAEIEDGKWHTHVEIPSPMPLESKLWVEVEESGGKKTVGSFDLKT